MSVNSRKLSKSRRTSLQAGEENGDDSHGPEEDSSTKPKACCHNPDCTTISDVSERCTALEGGRSAPHCRFGPRAPCCRPPRSARGALV